MRTISFYKLILLLCLSISVMSCGVLNIPYTPQPTLEEVQPGMTEDQILAQYGKPDLRSFSTQEERWTYIRDGKRYNVIFQNKRVVALNSAFDNPTPVYPQPAQVPDTPVIITNSKGAYSYDPFMMSPNQFESFFKTFKNTPFSSSKLDLLRSAVAAGNHFTCNQCIKLMNQFTFDDDKLNVLKILAPAIGDREYWKILDNLTFLSSKDKAKAILKI